MGQSILALEKIEKKFQTTHPGFKTEAMDLRRINRAASLAIGRSVVDVGSGAGLLVNYLGDQKRYARLTSVDIRDHSKRIVHPDATYFLRDIRKRDFTLDPHDTVFCMEVIEHCEAGYNAQILANLRRTALRRLVITVPFNEPEPVWWHDKPGGHRQRFTLPKLVALFPNAYATLLPRYGVDWIMLVEDRDASSPYFQIVGEQTFETILAK